jgi:beta-lactamase class D
LLDQIGWHVGFVDHNVAVIVAVIFQNISKNKSSRKKQIIPKKKSRAQALLQKLCRPYFPVKFRFDLG